MSRDDVIELRDDIQALRDRGSDPASNFHGDVILLITALDSARNCITNLRDEVDELKARVKRLEHAS